VNSLWLFRENSESASYVIRAQILTTFAQNSSSSFRVKQCGNFKEYCHNMLCFNSLAIYHYLGGKLKNQ